MSLPPVSGVLLAAGESRRFGGDLPKQVQDFLGEPLVRRQARTLLASRVAEVRVVVGYEGERVLQALVGLPIVSVSNPEYREGQSTSVGAAVRSLPSASTGAIFVPCDQPLLTPKVIDNLLWAFERTGSEIVVAAYRGRRGAPVLFGRSFFGDLEKLKGDVGGRQLLGLYKDQVAAVAVEEAGALEDADTPEELERLRQLARQITGDSRESGP